MGSGQPQHVNCLDQRPAKKPKAIHLGCRHCTCDEMLVRGRRSAALARLMDSISAPMDAASTLKFAVFASCRTDTKIAPCGVNLIALDIVFHTTCLSCASSPRTEHGSSSLWMLKPLRCASHARSLITSRAKAFKSTGRRWTDSFPETIAPGLAKPEQ